jgi:benzoylformate decarboxylase
LFAGFLPAMREKIVELLGGHDLILVLGAPAFTYHVDGAGPFIPLGAQLCQINDDPDSVARAPLGLAAVASLRLALADLLARPARPKRAAPPTRTPAPRAQASRPMSCAFVLQTLAEIRAPEDIVVEEAPTARAVLQAHVPFVRSETFYTMDSGGLGYGLPAAVGVALAKPESRVIALIGDGSSLYSIQALWTAVQCKLPMTFLILNNRRYAALEEFACVFGFSKGAPVQGTQLPGIDFAALARSMGCAGVSVSDPAQLKEVLWEALRSTVPTLVDIEIA